MTTEPVEVGQRVAHHRHRNGLTQAQLGKRVGRSTGWVGAIERGETRLDRLEMVTRVAAVLGVSVSDLRPDATAPAPRTARTNVPTGLVAALARIPLPLDTVHVVDIPALETRVAELHNLTGTDLVNELIELIPLVELAITHSRPNPTTTYWIWGHVYEVAAQTLIRAGEHAAAWVASDRAIRTASASGNRVQVAIAGLRAAQLSSTAGHWTHADAAAHSVVAGLEVTPNDAGITSLAGTAHLILADSAARRLNRGRALHHLDQAQALAAIVGPGKDWHDTAFGPTAVDCARLGVAVALQDAGDAIEIAETIDATPLTPSRRAHYFLDLARAEILRREPRQALRLLTQAAALDPDLIAHDPTAWAAIDDLSGLYSRSQTKSPLDQLRARTQRW